MFKPKGGSYSSVFYNGPISAMHANKDIDGEATTGATKTLTVAEV